MGMLQVGNARLCNYVGHVLFLRGNGRYTGVILFFTTFCISKYCIRYFQTKKKDGFAFRTYLLDPRLPTVPFSSTLSSNNVELHRWFPVTISDYATSFTFPCLMLCLLSWKAFLYLSSNHFLLSFLNDQI